MEDVQYNFAGQIALVTGGGSGIGRAAVLAFAKAGARVLITDINPAGAEVCAAVNDAGGSAIFHQADTSDPGACEAVADLALSAFGSLDFAFNNAGILGRFGKLGSLSAADCTAILNVNLAGVIHCMRAEVRAMEATGGVIVNNASVMGLVGAPGASIYSASKHGVVGLTKSAATEYGSKGIRVNAVCPGFIRTPMTVSGKEAGDKAVMASVEKTSLGRLGEPEEIAAAVLWLCSSGAGFVNGIALAVDGGYTAV